MLFHDCGRRMYGNHRHQSAYYMCHPLSNNRGRPDKYAGHEKAAYLREDADLARRQHNLVRQAQDCEPDDPFAKGLRQTYNDLETQRRTTLADLDAIDQATPAQRTTADDAGLLDALPYLTVNLAQAPEPLLRSTCPRRDSYSIRTNPHPS